MGFWVRIVFAAVMLYFLLYLAILNVCRKVNSLLHLCKFAICLHTTGYGKLVKKNFVTGLAGEAK
jgi:hypothetical protein